MKKVLLILAISIFLPGSLWSMKEEEIVINEKPVKKESKTPSKKVQDEPLPEKKPIYFHFIKFNNTKFTVSQDVIEQFESYNLQKKIGKSFSDEQTLSTSTLKLKKSASTGNLGSLRDKQTKDKSKLRTLRNVVWDITPIITEAFGVVDIDLDELIALIIDLTTGKQDPNNIKDQNET
jgi:hypothetical protein